MAAVLIAGRELSSPRGRGSGAGSLTSAGQLLTGAWPHDPGIARRRLEDRVASLSREPASARQRVEDFRQAGIPVRETIAADFAHEKVGLAAKQDRSVRQASCHKMTAQRALQAAARTCGDNLVCTAADAKRAEAELEAARGRFGDWHQHAEQSVANLEERHAHAQAFAEHRLANAEDEAAKRIAVAAKQLEEETARVMAAVAEERAKLEKQLALHESSLAAQTDIATARFDDAKAELARKKRESERQVAAAELRNERSLAASRARVDNAHKSKTDAELKLAFREDAQFEEHSHRLKGARARELEALENRNDRAEAAKNHLSQFEESKLAIFAECDKADLAQRQRVDAMEFELASRKASWRQMQRDAEAAAQQKVADVRALAEQLKAALRAEKQQVAKRTAAQAEVLQAHAQQHRVLCEDASSALQEQVARAEQHAANRTEAVEMLLDAQKSIEGARTEASLEQAHSDLELARRIADSRASAAAGHLMNYLKQGEEEDTARDDADALGLELWVPLSGGGRYDDS